MSSLLLETLEKRCIRLAGNGWSIIKIAEIPQWRWAAFSTVHKSYWYFSSYLFFLVQWMVTFFSNTSQSSHSASCWYIKLLNGVVRSLSKWSLRSTSINQLVYNQNNNHFAEQVWFSKSFNPVIVVRSSSTRFIEFNSFSYLALSEIKDLFIYV